MFDSVFVNAIAVFGASFLMSLTSTLLNRKFVDRENFVKWQEETKRWKAEKERAEKAGDKKLLTKLKRQEKRINQIGSKMMKGQMLSMISNMAILFTVWQLLLMYFAD
ncbi:MAG: EMC3/TMCO1 family protein [Candidatus Bathyarchaeota archaeon]|nr:EMC3/TMCO1 family protein [Candidatus Bathyarchaeota archaeon]